MNEVNNVPCCGDKVIPREHFENAIENVNQLTAVQQPWGISLENQFPNYVALGKHHGRVRQTQDLRSHIDTEDGLLESTANARSTRSLSKPWFLSPLATPVNLFSLFLDCTSLLVCADGTPPTQNPVYFYQWGHPGVILIGNLLLIYPYIAECTWVHVGWRPHTTRKVSSGFRYVGFAVYQGWYWFDFMLLLAIILVFLIFPQIQEDVDTITYERLVRFCVGIQRLRRKPERTFIS